MAIDVSSSTEIWSATAERPLRTHPQVGWRSASKLSAIIRKALMQRGFTFYDILGVSATASRDQIQRAYRASVRSYHPDVNHAPNAPQLMSALNEAWRTLSDPILREAYDSEINLRRTSNGKPAPRARIPIWQPLQCEKCGKSNVHLRVAIFYYVWSLLFYSRIRRFTGTLCPTCRSTACVRSALFSALLGPWSIPWGLPNTAKALLAAARGGERPRGSNARMLRHQAMAFLQRHNLPAAKAALAQAQHYEPDAAVSELLGDPEISGAQAPLAPRWLVGQTLSLAAVAMVITAGIAAFSLLAHPRMTKTLQHTTSDVSLRGASVLGRACLEAHHSVSGPQDQPSPKKLSLVRSSCIVAADDASLNAASRASDPAQLAAGTYLSYAGIADIRLRHRVEGLSELRDARKILRTLAAGASSQQIRTDAAGSLYSIVPWLSSRQRTLAEKLSVSDFRR